MGHTHVVGGALAGLAVSYSGGLGLEPAAALTVGAVATSKLPDIDAKINRGPDHRSFPHSLLLGGGGAILAAVILAGLLASGTASEVVSGSGGRISPLMLHLAVIGGAVGYFAHLSLDAATKSGIWLVMPKGQRFGLPKKYAVRTGSPTELLISGGMALVTLALGIAVFAPALGGIEFLYGSGEAGGG